MTIFVALMLALSTSAVVSACNPSITLSPPQGFAMTTITGTDFGISETITITYDGVSQPTIPLTVKTDETGSFSAIISIPDELAVGAHTISATDMIGYSASTTFTVVDMTGPQGAQGPQGIAGQNGVGTNGINGLNFNATGNVLVYNGTNGQDGQNGLNGKDGTNGINGINGADGKDGTNGTQGTQGPQGVNGQIVYVNPQTTNRLDLNYIAILTITLIVFTAAMVAASRKKQAL